MHMLLYFEIDNRNENNDNNACDIHKFSLQLLVLGDSIIHTLRSNDLQNRIREVVCSLVVKLESRLYETHKIVKQKRQGKQHFKLLMLISTENAQN